MTPQQLLRDHIETGEPLTEEELNAVVAAGLTDRSVWEDRGGGLYWHQGAHSIDPQ
jgi:hypothetical protein